MTGVLAAGFVGTLAAVEAALLVAGFTDGGGGFLAVVTAEGLEGMLAGSVSVEEADFFTGCGDGFAGVVFDGAAGVGLEGSFAIAAFAGVFFGGSLSLS